MNLVFKIKGVSLALLLLVINTDGGPLVPDSELIDHRTFSSHVTSSALRHPLPLEPFPEMNEYWKQSNTDEVNLEATSFFEGVVSSESGGLHCPHNGIFLKPGSCKDYYQCKELAESGTFAVHLLSCPVGTIFDDKLKSCKFPHQVTTRPECLSTELPSDVGLHENPVRFELGEISGIAHPRLNRQKRFAIIPALTGILSHPLAKAFTGIFGGFSNKKVSGDSSVIMKRLESKLVGIDGKIQNVQLSVLESQTENQVNAELLQNLIGKSARDSEANFEVTQNLINHGILENHISTAAIKGLITQHGIDTANNFVKVQVSLSEVRQFIDQRISETKANIKKGFESVSDLIDQSKVGTIVSKLLTTIKNFNQRSNHIQSLPEQNRIDEIKRTNGYLQYLESSTIQDTLLDIIHQNLAIPNSATDLSPVFTLDLLVDGLQVHVNMISSVVLANSFLAAKALEELNLQEFNTYMLRIGSSVARIKSGLSNSDGQGLIGEVKGVLDKVQGLAYASDILGLTQLLVEKRTDITKLESDIESLITASTAISEPATILRKPDFSSTPVAVPVGSWEKGKRVSYAIQHVSDTSISRVGKWSVPFKILDKANPTVQLPVAPRGIIRIIYRRFDQEQPECVAVVRNSEQRTFRDIDRDLLNAAAKPNEAQAVKEIRSLINDSPNVNIFIENKMTPLHYAAKHGNAEVMDILISKGANIHAKTSDNEEALHFAALFGAVKGVEYLISKGARINTQTKSLGLSPLHIAVANSHISATSSLINKGAFINIKDNNGLTPLHISIAGNGDTMDVLLESTNIDVNAVANDGLTPLHYASRSFNDVFVRKLLQHKDIDANPVTGSRVSPIHFAAISNNVVTITELIQHGVPVTVQDDSGSNTLHYAAFYGNQDAALALIQTDQSLNTTKNNDNKTPLDLAVENNRDSVSKVLRGDADEMARIFADEPSTVFEEPQSEGRDLHSTKLTVESNCTKDIVEQMARTSEATCAHIGNIEAYVNLVMSMIPLNIYYETQEEFSQIFKNYDHDLGVAQVHANLWRNGDSIVSGIRNTFQLAKTFEPEFNRKYKISQKRVEVIKESVDQVKVINETQQAIQLLEEQRVSATEAMNQVQVSAVKEYFLVTIAGITAAIDEKKRSLKEDFTIIHELEELVDFLEFVRKDSNKIRTVAVNTRGKIETFRDYLEHDKSAFQRHGRIAGETFDKLQEETIKNNEALAENKRKQEELERKIEEERQQVKALYVNIHESHEKLRIMRRKILDNISKAQRNKFIGALLTPIVVGIFLIRNANKAEKENRDLLQTTLAEGKIAVDALNGQIANNYKEIKNFQELMANSTSNSDQIRNEMHDFITLDGDLKRMEEKVETLLEAINKALIGVTVMKTVFDDVTQKLGQMIDLARTAKTEAEKLNAKYFIYNELTSLECNWRDAYIKVMNLDECTKNFEILY